MEVSRPDAQEPTPEELQDLEKLKALIEGAVADGKLSRAELDAIKVSAWEDGKITPEEAKLYSTLVVEKIRKGELDYDYDS